MTIRIQSVAQLMILMILSLQSCSSGKWPGSEDISVTWEVLSNTYTSRAQVEQISGDWYRIYPSEGFSLEPGEYYI